MKVTRSSSWSSGTTVNPSGASWVHRWRFSPLDEVSSHQMTGSVTEAGHGLSRPTVWGSPGLESPSLVMLVHCLTTGLCTGTAGRTRLSPPPPFRGRASPINLEQTSALSEQSTTRALCCPRTCVLLCAGPGAGDAESSGCAGLGRGATELRWCWAGRRGRSPVSQPAPDLGLAQEQQHPALLPSCSVTRQHNAGT